MDETASILDIVLGILLGGVVSGISLALFRLWLKKRD